MHDCQQICVDSQGSFICACMNGFTLQDDNHTCIGKYSLMTTLLACSHHFKTWCLLHTVDQNLACSSENACEQLCVLEVNVTADTFTEVCLCQSGYKLGSDKQSCAGWPNIAHHIPYYCRVDHTAKIPIQ